jgi:soluble lytic murein transglycosylase-like protein
VESSFRADAVSSAGAMGLMQLMPGTASDMGVKNPFDPADNINGGARYLAFLLKHFGDEELAIAAYNAGPGRVKKAGGVPNIPETVAYVRQVRGLAANYERSASSR